MGRIVIGAGRNAQANKCAAHSSECETNLATKIGKSTASYGTSRITKAGRHHQPTRHQCCLISIDITH